MTQDLIDIVAFRGEKLTLVWRDAEPYVAIRPICERLGIDAKSQRAKLQDADSGATGVLSTSVGADGKQREMYCLHVMDVPIWLAGIKPSRVKPELAEAVRAYRAECKLVLFEHVKARLLGEHREASEAVVRLRADLIARKPLWGKLRDYAAMGWSYERIWRAVKRPRFVVTEGLRDLLRLGVIAGLPENTPGEAPLSPQLDMFLSGT